MRVVFGSVGQVTNINLGLDDLDLHFNFLFQIVYHSKEK